MLDANTQAQVKAYLQKLASPLELVATLDESRTSAQMRELLEELAALSEKVSVRFDGADPRAPSFSVARAGEAARIRFAGLPMGHEFSSLILALLQVSGYPPKIEPALLERVASLVGDYRFETYVSLECHNCPEVVQALNLMAAVNPHVRHTMIEGGAYRAEVEEKNVLAVPTVFLNGERFAQGRMSLAEILAKLGAADTTAHVHALSLRPPYDVLIVGGGPAGAAAAIYAARKGLRVGLVAERLGGQVLDTLGIENFISVEYTEGPKLAAALENHVQHYGVDIMRGERVAELLPAETPAALNRLVLANGAQLSAHTVILATGARWRELGVPGEAELKGKGVCFCPHCDGPLFRGKRVAVIGGGNSGVEAAIDLAGLASHVTLLEFDDKLRADAVLQERLKGLANVTVIVSAQTTEILGEEKVTGLRYKDRRTGDLHEIALDGVFVQIGLVPNTAWLEGVVARNRYGEIEVDERCATSQPGIFAAGDCTTVPYKQIVISMGEGAKAALSAFDYLIRRGG
ncbi:MAG: alkyl hydroperoxide reductase subunit F [Rhodocyclaceae bacterium]|nr:alkyl hydroperoxide reductase subunit F [Rhodocyclaceae bacterium]